MRRYYHWIACGSITLVSHLAGDAFGQAQQMRKPDRPSAGASSRPALNPQELAARSIADLLSSGDRELTAKNYETALQYAEAVLLREPGNNEALDLRADTNLAEGRPEPARRDYGDVLKVQKSDFRANFGMGKIWLANRFHRQAISYLETAAAVAPVDKKVEAAVTLAQAYRGGGAAGKAVETLVGALQLKPNSIQALDQMATILADNVNELDRALDTSDKLLAASKEEFAKEPSNVEKVYQLWSAYNTRLAVLKSARDSLFVRDARANVTDQIIAGKEKEAAAVLNQVVDALIVQQNLNATLAFHNMRELAERMVQYDEQNVQYQMQLGLLYVKIYNYEQAAETFRKVLALDPSNAEAARQLEMLGGAVPASAPAP